MFGRESMFGTETLYCSQLDVSRKYGKFL